MGYERKRGKLAELNLLLRGGSTGSLSLVVAGRRPVERQIRDHLDTDTQLPRDAARKFVGAMAHPMNVRVRRADAARLRGHGILQPGVSDSLSGTNRSRYARLFGSEPGIDPYTRRCPMCIRTCSTKAPSSARDLRRCVRAGLKERLPENRILSHDLLEGAMRGGTVSDAHCTRNIRQLHRGRKPSPPMDPWGLADRRVASVARTRPGRPAEEPSLGAVQ